MKKLLILFSAVVIGLLAVSCEKYDDSALSKRVDDLSAQVSDLAKKVNDLTSQVTGLLAIKEQWDKGGYVSSIDDKSVPGQFTITFSDGKTIVIKDGAPGETPVITIKKEGDDFYWYVGSEKLGLASYTPTFTVNEQGEMLVTVNGVTKNLGVIKGDSVIQDVEKTEDKVVFTLNDDTVLELPLAKAFRLVIENPSREVTAGQQVEFPYTIENGNATTTVDAFAGGNYEVEVQQQAKKVVVTVPTPCVKGQVLVWAQNGEGLFSLVKLNFAPSGSGGGSEVAEVTIDNVSADLTAVPATAGEITANVVSNVAIEAEKPKASWVSVNLATKAEYKLTITVKKNSTGSPREADVKILRSDTKALVQTIHIFQQAQQQAPATLKVRRLWGKYATATAPWHSYLGGFNDGADRNVTMDNSNIYIAEAKAGVKKIWALKVSDGSYNKMLPTSTVQDAGTFPLCCPRVINYDGSPVLVVSNMTENAYQDDLYIYVYKNGISAEPTAINLVGATNGRLGDTFSFWGASASNSVDGKGLSKGLLYFDGSGNGTGVSIWKTVWSESEYGLPASPQNVQSRYGFDNGNVAAGAFWAYPDTKDAGVWGGRGTVEEPVQSAFCHVKAGADNLWSFWGNGVPDTECTTIDNGYYNNVTCYQFFPFNGKRYVAYTKQVNGADGRLVILEGNASDSWESIITTRNVFYQAAIQENAEMKDDYNESGQWSSHSGMDMCIRDMGDRVYIVVLKQSVGLSLFQMAVE